MKTEKGDKQFLTDVRFQFTRSQTIEVFNRLKSSNEVDEIEKINEGDIFLHIKYKSYKKSIRNFIISLVLICFSLFFQRFYFVAIIGLIICLSSLFGIRSNNISKHQKEYLIN